MREFRRSLRAAGRWAGVVILEGLGKKICTGILDPLPRK